jgi:hypothetical protein
MASNFNEVNQGKINPSRDKALDVVYSYLTGLGIAVIVLLATMKSEDEGIGVFFITAGMLSIFVTIAMLPGLPFLAFYARVGKPACTWLSMVRSTIYGCLVGLASFLIWFMSLNLLSDTGYLPENEHSGFFFCLAIGTGTIAFIVLDLLQRTKATTG